EQTTPLYANDQTANKNLDPSGGGKLISSGALYAQYDINENDTGTLSIFERTAGVTSVTGATLTPTLVAGDEFSISVSQVNSTALTTPVTITLSGTTA
ncbi:MAG: hypothetical protein GWN01_13380, partial [Nitrosopumilaceae archaeon]|nr:hypothetical protein [Nitrosopumilaceae archaeon]NIX62456.1 hypothetical protein [Nitrosopumilaceae archaeon]